MDIRQVQAVIAVADAGSFSSAAEELYISQSSLSKQIIALEAELGLQLFDRSRRKIALTPAGVQFVQYARRIDALHGEIRAGLQAYKAKPTLSIVAIPVIAQYGITNYIAAFGAQHPEIELTLEEREASAIMTALNAHHFDLAFVRDNYLDLEGTAFQQIARDRLFAVLSTTHRLAGRDRVPLTALADENFIMFDKGTVVHELAVDACKAAGFAPRIFHASLRVESVLGLVASNAGVALMMGEVARYHKHPNVVIVPLDECVESDIILVAPAGGKPNWSARRFLEFMKVQAAQVETGA